jgi:hypothetical protein
VKFVNIFLMVVHNKTFHKGLIFTNTALSGPLKKVMFRILCLCIALVEEIIIFLICVIK